MLVRGLVDTLVSPTVLCVGCAGLAGSLFLRPRRIRNAPGAAGGSTLPQLRRRAWICHPGTLCLQVGLPSRVVPGNSDQHAILSLQRAANPAAGCGVVALA